MPRDLDAEDRQDVQWETVGLEGGEPPNPLRASMCGRNADADGDRTAWARGRALRLEEANPNVLVDCIEIAARALSDNEWASILVTILAED